MSKLSLNLISLIVTLLSTVTSPVVSQCNYIRENSGGSVFYFAANNQCQSLSFTSLSGYSYRAKCNFHNGQTSLTFQAFLRGDCTGSSYVSRTYTSSTKTFRNPGIGFQTYTWECNPNWSDCSLSWEGFFSSRQCRADGYGMTRSTNSIVPGKCIQNMTVPWSQKQYCDGNQVIIHHWNKLNCPANIPPLVEKHIINTCAQTSTKSSLRYLSCRGSPSVPQLATKVPHGTTPPSGSGSRESSTSSSTPSGTNPGSQSNNKNTSSLKSERSLNSQTILYIVIAAVVGCVCSLGICGLVYVLSRRSTTRAGSTPKMVPADSA